MTTERDQRRAHMADLTQRTLSIAKQWIRELETLDVDDPQSLDRFSVTTAALGQAASLIVERGGELAASHLDDA